MATATVPKNQDRIFRKIISVIGTITREADKPVGAATIGRRKKRCWVCEGVPSVTVPTGMAVGDLILDTTTDDVYRYTTGTTYVNMTS